MPFESIISNFKFDFQNIEVKIFSKSVQDLEQRDMEIGHLPLP